VLIQLSTSQLMTVPEPGPSLLMVHRWSGISIFAMVILLKAESINGADDFSGGEEDERDEDDGEEGIDTG
jgi:hypothetical protein